MAYIGPSIETGFRQRYVYTATAGQTSFSGNDSVGISLTYTDSEYLDVYQNGVLLVPGSDYAATTGTTVVLVTGASADDKVEMVAYQAFGVADTVSRADGGAFGGAVSMASTLTVTGASTLSSTLDVTGTTTIGNGTSGVAKINGGSSSSGQLIFMDGGTNRARIGVPTGTTTLSLSGSNTLTGDVVITADGEVTMPTQPAFLVQPASEQADIPINAVTVIVFGTERFDQNGDFASNTFTAPVTGKYLLTVHLYTTQNHSSTSYFGCRISTSNRNYENIFDPDTNDGNNAFSHVLSVVADMDASDTASVSLNVPNSGSAQTDISTSSFFSGALLC